MRFWLLGLWVSLSLGGTMTLAIPPKACIGLDEATKATGKEVCVDVHIYDVVESEDGTRFLDVCKPDVRDEDCRFTIVSLRADREEVGELMKYRDANVQVRGIVQAMHGRSGMLLSHVRQFHGGPPKFRANPKLLRGFAGEQGKPAILDPNLRAQGGHRAFMNAREQEALPR